MIYASICYQQASAHQFRSVFQNYFQKKLSQLNLIFFHVAVHSIRCHYGSSYKCYTYLSLFFVQCGEASRDSNFCALSDVPQGLKTRRSQRAEPSPAREGGGGRGHSAGTFTRRLCDIFGILSSSPLKSSCSSRRNAGRPFCHEREEFSLAARRRRRVYSSGFDSTWRFCSGEAGGTASVPGKFTLIWMG